MGPRARFGRVRKMSPSRGFDPRTVQPVASRYTDCAILAPNNQVVAYSISAAELGLVRKNFVVTYDGCLRSKGKHFQLPPCHMSVLTKY